MMDKLVIPQNKLNTALSVARVFAILSVVAAHVTIQEPEIVGKVLNDFGSVGVIIYIMMSGYFYRTAKFNNIFSMLGNKCKNVVIPWIVMGSAVYLFVNVISGTAISAQGLLLWILGYKTYLYYISMLMLCYIIFYKRCKAMMYISIILNIISVYLTAFDLIDFGEFHLTNYLNIFNWVGYFSVGLLLQDVKAEKILGFISKVKYPAIILSVLLYAVICICNIPTGYFSFVGMPFQLLWAITIVSVSLYSIFDKKIIHTISNMTFSVYLVHMPIIGILSKFFNKFVITQLLSPVIVVLVCLILLYIGFFVTEKIKFGKIYCLLTGLRMNRNIKGK